MIINYQKYLKFIKFDYLVLFITDVLFYFQCTFKIAQVPQEVYIKARYLVVVF